MKRVAILINAYSKLEHALYQSKRLKEEFERRNIRADILRNDFFAASIEDGGKISSQMSDYDFCVYLDKDKYVSRLLEKMGMRLFNHADAIEACDDKMTTAIRLSNAGIPFPETLPGLLCYDPDATIDQKTLHHVVDRVGLPVIVKTSYGSMGKGVFKANTFEQLCVIADKVKCLPHLFQHFVASSYGRDIRVIVIGNKYVAAMERRSDNDFRSNLELGGTGSAITPPKEVMTFCEKISIMLDLDYCGIDILYGEHGYYVCEVNSNAFFRGIEQVTGINIAKIYVEHMLSSV